MGAAQAGANVEEAASASEVDAADGCACKKNLNKLFEAIQAFRQKNNRLPNWLSDLHPEFLKDSKTFVCPAVRRKRDFQSWRDGLMNEVWWDPSVLPISYSYEFCVAPYPLWAGHASTVREYKLRAMELLGNNVPMLRCVAHPPTINLSFGGQFYESGTYWENNFTNCVLPIAHLLPRSLFREESPRAGAPFKPIPDRDSKAPSRLLDLNGQYMAPLDIPWLWKNPRGNSLASLPRGVHTLPLVGLAFDLRGIVQLRGTGGGYENAPFPERVDGIPVRQKCRQIHFLHGCASSARDGTEIGRYEVNYSSGLSLRIPIFYGSDVMNWWTDPNAPLTTNAPVAWVGSNEASKARGKAIRLCHQQWKNLRESEEIVSINFVSALTSAHPFLIAITLED